MELKDDKNHEALQLLEKLPNKKRRNIRMLDAANVLRKHWWKKRGAQDFLSAQAQVAVILLIAYIGNNWEPSYPRNENYNPTMFWVMNGTLLVAALVTLKHEEPRNNASVQLLSRAQTEEWKGWMQWVFIMYHYYRAYYLYNEIRVFVSAYVWMTGFGNFLYFDKKQDFSTKRGISMWLRINYFPVLLSLFVGVPFDLFYIVPLHTTAFFITMMTCYVASKLPLHIPAWKRNAMAVAACCMTHALFYETPLVNLLEVLFGKEIHFRFQADKYSALLGIVSGYFWNRFQQFMQLAHGVPAAAADDDDGDGDGENTNGQQQHYYYSQQQIMYQWGQRVAGVALLTLWYGLFGRITDKYTYNPIHPFIFWMPVAGWLMVRNSSKYLTELHSTALEFFGRITLETYVLQFHVFMCNNVQHIPVVIPGADAKGPMVLKILNMLVTGVGFVALAYWARKVTVTTQTTVTDLIVLLQKGPPSKETDNKKGVEEEKAVPLKDSNRKTNDVVVINDSDGNKLPAKQSDVV